MVKNIEAAQTFNEERLTKEPLFQEGNTQAFVINLMPGQALPPHPHPNAHVYVYVVEGDGIVTIDDHVQGITEKDVIHAYDQQIVSIENTGMDPMSLYIVLSRNL